MASTTIGFGASQKLASQDSWWLDEKNVVQDSEIRREKEERRKRRYKGRRILKKSPSFRIIQGTDNLKKSKKDAELTKKEYHLIDKFFKDPTITAMLK